MVICIYKRYYEDETSLYYLNQRCYNPEWGRFINADDLMGSVGGLQSHNVFAYCANNPVMHSDPSGREWIIDGDIKFWVTSKADIIAELEGVAKSLPENLRERFYDLISLADLYTLNMDIGFEEMTKTGDSSAATSTFINGAIDAGMSTSGGYIYSLVGRVPGGIICGLLIGGVSALCNAADEETRTNMLNFVEGIYTNINITFSFRGGMGTQQIQMRLQPGGSPWQDYSTFIVNGAILD